MNSDQQPAQFPLGLPNGLVLATLTGEVHNFSPGPQYYYWFEGVRFLSETGSDRNYYFSTPTTSDPQSAPPPWHTFVQPDGQIIFATDGVTHGALSKNAATPAITVVDDTSALVWTQPLPSPADSVVGLPNHLVAITSGGHVTVFNSTGQKIAGP